MFCRVAPILACRACYSSVVNLLKGVKLFEQICRETRRPSSWKTISCDLKFCFHTPLRWTSQIGENILMPVTLGHVCAADVLMGMCALVCTVSLLLLRGNTSHFFRIIWQKSCLSPSISPFSLFCATIEILYNKEICHLELIKT